MSDQYFRLRAERRARITWLLIALAAVVACGSLSIFYVFRDTCTGGFERSPQAVVRSYIAAIQAGDPVQVQRCWELNAYMDLASGCSENCVNRILGTAYDQVEIQPGEITVTQDGRAHLPVLVNAACSAGGETYTGQITLDSVSAEVPWRHWKIVNSGFGGMLGEPWCR